ncbi:hypothetical protein FS837_005382 [Tulasnella sp. UAMH 9824]|nr:hypothetical protein FS837_005382 [Tulasnella sp. UAMH 9824]
MVTTRGKHIKFDTYASQGELDRERDDEAPAKPPLKRRRTKQPKPSEDDPTFNPSPSSGKGKGKATSDQNQLITRRSGRGGKLRDLMNMPVDIFTEVSSYLGPYDLRRLALTSKRLRDILMTKEARHIWKNAIASTPDLPECPTDLNEPQYIMSYFDSRAVMLVAKSYRLAPSYYIEAIKKAGREYEALSEEQAGEYLLRLQEMHDYHLLTGWAMLQWNERQIAFRADDIAMARSARFESIKVKLFDLGWDEKDFPMSNKEFKALVLRNQKLTPKIWHNIRPKLESLLEAGRNDRLEMERQQRQSKRETAIRKFYHQLGVETLNLPIHPDYLTSLLPEFDEVFAVPSIKSLLTNDTETVTEDQWIEVAPEARLFVLIRWRDCLKQVTARLENGATASVENTKTGSKATYSKAETVEAVSDSIEGLQVKLSYATSALVCGSAGCAKVFWFPHVISHALSSHYSHSMDGIVNALQPLRPDVRDLMDRLLKDLKRDPETAKVDPPVSDQAKANLLCTRCDARVATYMCFNQLIDHFLEAQRWFDKATEAIRKAPDICYPSRTVSSQLPTIVNDHDWISRDALLVRQDDKKAKEALLRLQSDFQGELTLDPRRESLIAKSEIKACSTGKIALHIRQK